MRRKSDEKSYVQRHNKHYKLPFVNATRLPAKRREIYALLIQEGYPWKFAREARDFSRTTLREFLGLDI